MASEQGAPRGEACEQPDCGAIWPRGSLTAVDAGKGKKARLCPKCIDQLVRRSDMAKGGRCGMCEHYQHEQTSQEGDALGFCGFHGVPVAAADEKCDAPGAYQPVSGSGR